MRFFFIDETNMSFSKHLEFFICGGVIVSESELGHLTREVLKIKSSYNFPLERPIKWPNISWGSEPPLEPRIHAEIKSRILDLVKNSKIKIIICLSPHLFSHRYKIVGSEVKFVIDADKQKRTQTFGLELCLQKFNQFLAEEKETGLVIADHFGNLHSFMKSHGLSVFANGTTISPLENISHPTIQIENEFSPIGQITDVVLGAIAYSFNSKNFLPILKSNFWSNKKDLLHRGINIYPLKPKSSGLAIDIDKLKIRFNALLNA